MFDKSYNKVHDPEDSNLKIGMQKSIVHPLTVLQITSFTNLTTDTQLILSDTYEVLKQWGENNKEGFLIHRKLF